MTRGPLLIDVLGAAFFIGLCLTAIVGTLAIIELITVTQLFVGGAEGLLGLVGDFGVATVILFILFGIGVEITGK